MASDAVTGILTLSGVVVGGGLNLVTGMVLDRRRERRDVRTAVRLIIGEIKGFEFHLDVALRSGSWGSVKDIETARWTEHKAQLAATLGNADWGSIHGIYESIRLFAEEASDAGHDEEMAPEDLAHVRLTLDVLADALPRIERLAGTLVKPDLSRRSDLRYDRYLKAGGGPVD